MTTDAPKAKTSFLPAPNPKAVKERKAKTPRDPNAPRLTGKNKEQLAKVITVHAEKNPRRTGSETYKIFDFYKTGETVEQFLKKGGRMVDIKADLERKHISLADAE